MSTNINIEQLVNTLLTLQTQEKQISEQINTIKLLISEQLPNGGTVGNHKITVTHPQRIDWTKIVKAYPPEKYAHLYELKPSTVRFKEALAPATLNQYKTTGKQTVTVR